MGRSLYPQFVAAMDALEEHHGGNKSAAARSAGASPQTWNHWKSGKRPGLEWTERVLAAARRIKRRIAR